VHERRCVIEQNNEGIVASMKGPILDRGRMEGGRGDCCMDEGANF
jgi:hypothetical protein